MNNADCKGRSILKAKRGRNVSSNQLLHNVPSSVENKAAVAKKRKYEEDISNTNLKQYNHKKKKESDAHPQLPAKYSANSRLQVYRKYLEQQKDEIIKPHTVINQLMSGNGTSHKIKCAGDEKLKQSFSFIRSFNCERQKSSGQLDNVKSINYKLSSQEPKKNSTSFLSCTESNSKKDDEPISNFKMDEDCEMEWSSIDEATIISDIQKIRQNKDFETPKEFLNNNTDKESNLIMDNHKLYVVIDTNVFLSNLNSIKNIMTIKGNKELNIIIPWIVIQELDYMKDGRSGTHSIQMLANKAIIFINENLVANSDKFKGQKVQDAMSSKFSSSSADDSILNCCLQIHERGTPSVLLSNDVNLRNKMLINGLKAFSATEAFHQISTLLDENEYGITEMKGEEIQLSLGHLFSFIILREMKHNYGDLWDKMKLMKEPPWSFIECLERIKYYWTSIYKHCLQKQTFKIVEDLINFIKEKKCLKNDTNLKIFIELSLSLCCFFKNGFPKYSQNITTCVKDLQECLK